MPIYRLDRRPIFPPPEEAEPDGLLAVGGDLSAPRLIEAYRNGIFPWFEPGEEILWWCPDPRLVLIPSDLIRSRSLRATIRNRVFDMRFDTAFRQVVEACARTPRKHEDGTWIGPEIVRGYSILHERGLAHSAESWVGDELVGGLYGVRIGRMFFGESMFALRPDASKVALATLAEELIRRDVGWIDCQVATDHLQSLGAREMPRAEFLAILRDARQTPFEPGPWNYGPSPSERPSKP